MGSGSKSTASTRPSPSTRTCSARSPTCSPPSRSTRCQQVLRDGETFSSAGYARVMGPVMGHTILEMDEPEHHRYRVADPAGVHAARRWSAWEAELVGPVVDELHRRVRRPRAAPSSCASCTFPFPVNVIAGMLGLPDERPPAVPPPGRSSSSASASTSTAALNASQCAARLLRSDPRRAARRTRRTTSSACSRRPSSTASASPTTRSSRSSACCCRPAPRPPTARRATCCSACSPTPTSSTRCAPTASLMPQAIEEGLRWEPPLLTASCAPRPRDTEVDGVPIPAGAVIGRQHGRRPTTTRRAGTSPDAFDIFREPQQHMAFAFGPAHVPRHAPRPHGDAGRARPAPRPAARPAPRPRRRRRRTSPA